MMDADRSVRPSLLADRDLTPEECAARDEDPRPGVWAGERTPGFDLRLLTQEQTDALIRAELCDAATPSERADVREICGPFLQHVHVDLERDPRWPIHCQRGGSDSDPLVRVLAYRAWGDRDRRWFELRGVRKGEQVAGHGPHTGTAWCALARPREYVMGIAACDARPGQGIQIGDQVYCVSDRLRERPELWWEADLRPITHDLPFDQPSLREAFDFDMCEHHRDDARGCDVVLAWRDGRRTERTISRAAMVNARYDLVTDACRAMSEELGPRRERR